MHPPGVPDPGSASQRSAVAPADFACMRIDGDDGTVRLAVSGELDLATEDELDRALSAAQAVARLVTLDLRRLVFMDCRGLAVLVAAAARAKASGERFRVVRGPASVDRLFALTGFEHRLDLTSGVAV